MDDGRLIGKPLSVKNNVMLIVTLLKWVRSITDETAVWAIEDGRGFARRLADGLLLAGQEVIWVPSRLAAAHRKLHEATGAKSDPIDAAAVARAAIAKPGLDRHRIDQQVRELRVLVGYRADLVKRRTMAINQIKAQLNIWLGHTPGDLTRARNLTSLTTLMRTEQLGSHVRQALTDMACDRAGLNDRVRDLDTTIRELVTPLAPQLLQITGISHNSAAVLIAEIGDITRFRTSARLARCTGMRSLSGDRVGLGVRQIPSRGGHAGECALQGKPDSRSTTSSPRMVRLTHTVGPDFSRVIRPAVASWWRW